MLAFNFRLAFEAGRRRHPQAFDQPLDVFISQSNGLKPANVEVGKSSSSEAGGKLLAQKLGIGAGHNHEEIKDNLVKRLTPAIAPQGVKPGAAVELALAKSP